MVDSVAEIDALAGKRVLVTGGSGFLGSHMVERLLQEGAHVGALARQEGKLAFIRKRDYTFIQCDLTDSKQTMEATCSFAPQIVFHFASHPDAAESFDQAQASIQSNLVVTLHILEAFRMCDGELFVYGDSCKVYGNSEVPYREAMPIKPISSYAIAKAAGWRLCDLYHRLYGVATVSVRPTLIYGPRQSYNVISFVVDCVLDHSAEVRLDGGTQTRDPLFIDDAIEAFIATARLGAKVGGRVINIGGGKEHSVLDLATLIVETMGSSFPVVSRPQRIRPTDMLRSYCDNVEARTILEWWPRTSLRTGLEKTVQYLIASRLDCPSAIF